MAEVLIIGAGPVGLFMAALLLQDGVDVQVLEQRGAPEPQSRAIGIHPPALAALAGTGVAEAMIAEGVQIRRGMAMAGGKCLARMSFAGVSDRFPFVLSLPQARTEAHLERRVNELGDGALHRGVRLTGLSDDGGRVSVEADSRSGTLRYSAPLVIAADGVRSTVRALQGADVRVKEYPDSYLMGDFADGTGFGPDAALFLSGAGIVESFPLPGQLRRWVVRLGTGDSAAGGPAPADQQPTDQQPALPASTPGGSWAACANGRGSPSTPGPTACSAASASARAWPPGWWPAGW